MPGVLRVKLPNGSWQDINTTGPVGPAGPAGPAGPTGPAGPAGQDSWPLLAQATPPTAEDYGEDTIPLNAVWIQTPT